MALVTILQFAEGLSDRQAADAVRSRIDWKYVLGLELTDPGFDASVLCEFRSRLLAGEAKVLLFETLLSWCNERQLLKAGGRQRTDCTHILAAVRALNRIEVVGEGMRHALNTLTSVAPDWLRGVSQSDWAEHYARRAEDDRLPSKQAAREALALTIGNDGWRLLTAVYQPDAPIWLREVPAVDILRRMWIQIITGMAASCAGGLPTTSHQPRSLSAPPTISKLTMPTSTLTPTTRTWRRKSFPAM